ncbi:MAG TPA: ABC transporter ATP-binding protein [Thermoanaerobaculia bacterium]|nr:ABC transporter ATP-binding protein [Thermoanaerobaculia bacterium]
MTLRAEGISVRRGGRVLLDDVSFAANAGEIVGIIGPNGAGKTTLFEAVAGFLPDAAGKVEGAAFFYLPDGIRPWSERRAGWVLDFFARLFARERDHAAVAALQLEHLLPQRIGSLSKGEAKRVALALALSAPLPVLLLDEPFDGLDFRQTRGAMALLRERANAGRTLVLSIHQLTDAAAICSRFLLLDHGRAIASGTLAELRARAGRCDATLEEVFLALE